MPGKVRLGAIALVALAFVLFPPGARAATFNVQIANITDLSFVATWMTDAAVSGQVRLVSGSTVSESAYPNGRGADFAGRTHYVQVTGLQPGQTYLFDLISGSAVDDNYGAHYSVTTGPTLPAVPGNDIFTGRIKNPDGSYASDAIVLLRLQDANATPTPGESQWWAAPVAGDAAQYFGEWRTNLKPVRAADLSAYFAYSPTGDQASLAVRGAFGTWTGTVDVSTPRLGRGFEVTLAGTAVTATPTPSYIPPSPTRTATRTQTPLPTPTSTATPEPPTPVPATAVPPTRTRVPASATPADTPTPLPTLAMFDVTPTTEGDLAAADATQIAAEVATEALLPQPQATRAAATLIERLSVPTLVLLGAAAAFFSGGFLILLAIYFWRRGM